MRKLLLAACVPTVFFASCDKEKPAMSKEQIARVADSIATMRIKELDQRAQRDLEYRMKIELKGKSDSIIAASANSKSQIPNSKTADSIAKVQGVNPQVQIPNPTGGNSKVQIPNPKGENPKVSQ